MTNKKKTSLKAAIAEFDQKYEVVKTNGRLVKKRKKTTPEAIHATISIMRKFPKEK